MAAGGDEHGVLGLAAARDGRVPGDRANGRKRGRLAGDGEDLAALVAGQAALVVAAPLLGEALTVVCLDDSLRGARRELRRAAQRRLGREWVPVHRLARLARDQIDACDQTPQPGGTRELAGRLDLHQLRPEEAQRLDERGSRIGACRSISRDLLVAERPPVRREPPARARRRRGCRHRPGAPPSPRGLRATGMRPARTQAPRSAPRPRRASARCPRRPRRRRSHAARPCSRRCRRPPDAPRRREASTRSRAPRRRAQRRPPPRARSGASLPPPSRRRCR